MEMIYKLDTEIEHLKTARSSPGSKRQHHHHHHHHASAPEASRSDAAPASKEPKGGKHAAAKTVDQEDKDAQVVRIVKAILKAQGAVENN